LPAGFLALALLACGFSIGDAPPANEATSPPQATAPPEPSATPEPTATLEPTATATAALTGTPDPAANFVPYVSEAFGLRFSYPEDWATQESADVIAIATGEELLADTTTVESGALMVLSTGDTSEFSSADPVEMLGEALQSFGLGEEFEVAGDTQPAVINGQSGATATLVGENDDGVPLSALVSLVINGQRAAVVAGLTPSDQQGEHGPTFEAILDTLEVDEAAAPPADAESVDLGALELGQETSGAVAAGRAAQYSYSASAGTAVTVLVEPSESLDAVLELYAADDLSAPLLSVDKAFAGDAEELLFSPESDTEYVIQVRGYEAEAGEFAITLTQGGPTGYGTTLPGSQLIAADRLDEDDEHFFPFTSDASSAEVMVRVAPEGELDVVVELFNDDSEELIETVDASFGDERTAFVLDEAANYYIRVTGYEGQAGSYTITLMAPPEVTLELAFGDTVYGNFADAGELGFYISGEAEESVRFSLSPLTDLDLSAGLSTLEDATTLTEVDSSAAGGAETLDYTYPAEAVYVLTVGSSGTGTFEMLVD
ncbi:MAG: hypothetical protein ACRDHL_01100, partial [Candidatus Promineifilaceae bacterium]